jgi:hypothetical protein
LVLPVIELPTVKLQVADTVIVVEAELVHPVEGLVYVYVIVNVPPPETAGLNVFPDTPVPVNVPPVGEPVKVIGALDTNKLEYVPALTIGKGLTVNVIEFDDAVEGVEQI